MLCLIQHVGKTHINLTKHISGCLNFSNDISIDKSVSSAVSCAEETILLNLLN